MEHILGQPTRFVLSSCFTSLSEELSKVGSCTHTKVIIISCLSNIVENLVSSADVKVGIERAMLLIGNQLHEVSRLQRGAVRIFVGPCLPRNTQNYSIHAKSAVVSLKFKRLFCYVNNQK
jgi:hypothetical protein